MYNQTCLKISTAKNKTVSRVFLTDNKLMVLLLLGSKLTSFC